MNKKRDDTYSIQDEKPMGKYPHHEPMSRDRMKANLDETAINLWQILNVIETTKLTHLKLFRVIKEYKRKKTGQIGTTDF